MDVRLIGHRASDSSLSLNFSRSSPARVTECTLIRESPLNTCLRAYVCAAM